MNEEGLDNIILRSSVKALNFQLKNGAFQPGSNGPHNDFQTPVRNTSHWLVALSYAYQSTKRTDLKNGAERAVDYLLTNDARPQGYTFVHRNQPGKDRCNGLVGQAWTIEALAIAGRILSRNDAMEEAIEIAELHPFDDTLGLWKTIDIDGDIRGYCRTFNQQLWFAAALSLLPESTKVHQSVKRFLDRCADWSSVNQDGLIQLTLSPTLAPADWFRFVTTDESGPISNLSFLSRSKIEYSNVPIKPLSSIRSGLTKRAIGYQSFNLYGFAILKSEFPDHPLWENKIVKQALRYVSSDQYRYLVDINPYAYEYNPTGFEIAYSAKVFNCDRIDMDWWINEQLSRCYNPDTGLMDQSNADSATLSARIYEGVRLIQ